MFSEDDGEHELQEVEACLERLAKCIKRQMLLEVLAAVDGGSQELTDARAYVGNNLAACEVQTLIWVKQMKQARPEAQAQVVAAIHRCLQSDDLDRRNTELDAFDALRDLPSQISIQELESLIRRATS